MRKMMMALVMSLVGISATASAELKDYGRSGSWNIYSDDHDCTMTGDFKNGSNLAFDFNARTTLVTVRVTVPHTKTLKNGDIRDIETIFTNTSASSVDAGWGTKKFMAFDYEGTIFLSRSFTEEFLVDLARYQTLGFFYKDTLLNAYDLDGSGAAIAMLRACAKARSRVNPSDPFEKDTV